MKTLKLLFGAMSILFIQGFSVESSAQNILDSLRNKEIGYPYIIVTNSNSIFSVNDGPLLNKFIEAFDKERKNASYTMQKKDENGETVSEIHAFKDGKEFIIYAYDRIDHSSIEIIYAKSEKIAQEKITQENYEQLFNNFVETLKADFDSKYAEAENKYAEVANKLAKADADSKLAEMTSKLAEMTNKLTETADKFAEFAKNNVDIQSIQADADSKLAEMTNKLAEMTNKLTETADKFAEFAKINDHFLKNSTNSQSVRYGKSKNAELFINGVKVTVEEARKMGLDIVEIEDL
jgi:hypothetical protein